MRLSTVSSHRRRVARCACSSRLCMPSAGALRWSTSYPMALAPRSRFPMTTNPHARQPTALLAEDEPMLRAQLRARLTQAWPELAVAAEAENGEQALALYETLKPD